METLLSASCAQTALHVGESGETAAARRHAATLSMRAGFDDTLAGMLALVVTEAATNIEKHAGEGEILLQVISDGVRLGVEVLALDKGPGIADLSHSLLDGSSSTGTYGVGMGAMRRQSHEFEVYSRPGAGTAIRMVLWGSGPAASRPGPCYDLGAVCVPYPGEVACGDGWVARFSAQRVLLMVCDGLGHGPAAAAATGEASRVAASQELPPASLLQRMDGAMRSTRGAAVAVAEIDWAGARVDFAGIGNIAASVTTEGRRHQLVSHNGIVGANLGKVQTFSTGWNADAIFIAHSDGLSARWQLQDYPGLEWAHPALIAGVLYRDHGRGRDDTTVLVLKEAKGQGPCSGY